VNKLDKAKTSQQKSANKNQPTKIGHQQKSANRQTWWTNLVNKNQPRQKSAKNKNQPRQKSSSDKEKIISQLTSRRRKKRVLVSQDCGLILTLPACSG